MEVTLVFRIARSRDKKDNSRSLRDDEQKKQMKTDRR